jgi:hypothetical protein
MKRIIETAFAAALVLALTGCADHQVRLESKEQALRERVDKYHELITLRDFDSAASLVSKEARGDFRGYAAAMSRGYMLDSYSIIRLEMNQGGDQAAVVVSRSFIMPATVTLQTKEFTQQWVLGDDGAWYLAGPPY